MREKARWVALVLIAVPILVLVLLVLAVSRVAAFLDSPGASLGRIGKG